MESGLVTTIIPVYNRAAMLETAVASVLAQTYRPIEIAIVDDGSTDGTAAAVDRLAREHPEVRALHQPNGGPGAAREAGRRAARGEFIQHLDSDDVLLPRKFELQVAALRAHPECGAAYAITAWRHRDGSVDSKPWARSGERFETMFPAMLRSRFWATTSALYRAALLESIGPWLPLRMEEDWEYDARLAAVGVRLCFVDEVLSEQRSHSDASLSGHHTPATLRDRAIAHESIYHSARRAGIGNEAPEMQHFARELFLLARQCGAAGLARESRTLLQLARAASGRRLDLTLYALLARVVGWRAAGRLASFADRVRS
ncbi:MAG TPA: glycosyltransferase family 2 protein [Thermoanaerobaculia bacterium]|nr:glycosyltransferase family 2 protein [Thermoanaerobaculia bacterium]